MQYRREIDGLRAIAVLSVVIYHLFPHAIPGGFAGVDAFFVISGFLIAQVIQGGIDAGTFSVRSFYRNRVRRLFPAMAVVTAATLALGYVWLLPGAYESAAKAAGAALLFVSNIFFAKQAGYFAPDVAHNPMLHTWSLAVEEQFYLVFPFLLLALARWGRCWRLVVLVGFGAMSLWWAVHTQAAAPELAFYGLHTRAWEMLVGAVAGLYLIEPCARLSARMRGGMAWAGLGALVSSFWILTPQSAHPGFITLLPVLATAAILLGATGGTQVARVLSWGPAVYVGMISYSLYLWHQPAIVFGSLQVHGPMTPMVALAIVAVSVVLAHATTRWVEAPFRTGSLRPVLTVPRFWMANLGLVLVALCVVVQDGAPGRVPAQVRALARGDAEIYEALRACHVDSGDKEVLAAHRFCVVHPTTGHPRLAIWGDSHAHSLTGGMVQLLPQMAVEQLSVSGCPPMAHFTLTFKPARCTLGAGMARAHALMEGGAEILVLAARWTQSANPTKADNGEGGIEKPEAYPYQPLDGRPMAFEDIRAGLFDDYAQAVAAALEAGRVVALVYPSPEMGWHVPKEAARRAWVFGAGAPDVSVSRAFFHERASYATQRLDAIPDHPHLVRVRPEELLCELDRCYGQRDGEVLYADDDHLGDRGSALLADAVLDALVAQGFGGLLHGPRLDPQEVAHDDAYQEKVLGAIGQARQAAAVPGAPKVAQSSLR